MEPDKLQIYEILAHQHQPMLLAYIFSFVHDAQLAEDIAQETFLIAYRKLATLDSPESFGVWLRRIARLEIFNALRGRSPEIPFEPAVLEGIDTVFASLDQQSSTEKYPPTDVDTIGKILQPLMHHPPGNREGNDTCNQY